MICATAWKNVWNLEVLREISFSFSPLKQKRCLNRFVLSPSAKLLRYEMWDFYGLKYRKLNFKSRSSAQYAYKRYLKNNSFEAQKSSGRNPKLTTKKSEKKIVTDVLKDLKTSLERIKVVHNAYSRYDTIFRGTVRRILKKYGVFFQEMLHKKSVRRRIASVFVQNGVSICSKSCSLSGRVLFLLTKQGCASPTKELLEFFDEMEWDFLKKNTKNLSSDKRSLMFRGAIRSNGRKLLVKCPNKLYAVGYLEILTIYEEKMHFLDIFFNKIMLLCINRRRLSAILSKKTSGRYWNDQHTVLIWVLLEIYGRFWSNDYENRQFFGKI